MRPSLPEARGGADDAAAGSSVAARAAAVLAEVRVRDFVQAMHAAGNPGAIRYGTRRNPAFGWPLDNDPNGPGARTHITVGVDGCFHTPRAGRGRRIRTCSPTEWLLSGSSSIPPLYRALGLAERLEAMLRANGISMERRDADSQRIVAAEDALAPQHRLSTLRATSEIVSQPSAHSSLDWRETGDAWTNEEIAFLRGTDADAAETVQAPVDHASSRDAVGLEAELRQPHHTELHQPTGSAGLTEGSAATDEPEASVQTVIAEPRMGALDVAAQQSPIDDQRDAETADRIADADQLDQRVLETGPLPHPSTASPARERTGQIIETLLVVLSGHPEGLSANDAIALVEKRLPLTDVERSEYPNSPGIRRFDKIVKFAAIPPVKARWIASHQGTWTLTSAGRSMIGLYDDPADLAREASRLYRYWKKNRTQTDDAPVGSLESEAVVVTTSSPEDTDEAIWTDIQGLIHRLRGISRGTDPYR